MITKAGVEKALKECEDPELGMDIFSMGLVYEINVDSEGNVKILMTLTSIACPYGPQMMDVARQKVLAEGAKTVDIQLTFDPPWKPSEEVLAALGL